MKQIKGTETQEEIEKRLSRLSYELSFQKEYDYVVVNDDLETAIEDVSKLLDEAKNA